MELYIDGLAYTPQPDQSLLGAVKALGLDGEKLSQRPLAAKIAGEGLQPELYTLADKGCPTGSSVHQKSDGCLWRGCTAAANWRSNRQGSVRAYGTVRDFPRYTKTLAQGYCADELYHRFRAVY